MIIKSLNLPSYGGIQSHVWELSQKLIEKGHHVTILTSRSLGKGIQKRMESGRSIIELPKAPLYRLPVGANLLDESHFNDVVKAWVRKHHEAFDVIHLHGRSGLWIPWRLPHLAPKCIWTVHGLTAQEWVYNGSQSSGTLHAKWSHWLEKLAAQRVGHVIAVSVDISHEVIRFLGCDPSRISVVPNGIIQRGYVAKRSDTLIGYAGRLVTLKGIMLLPDLLQRLDPSCKLVLIGKGPAKDKLIRAFKRQDLEDRVIWIGQIPQQQVVEWLMKISVLVAPSYYEPQGRVVLEAMSVGCPVVAGNTGGLSEMITHGVNGLLCPPGDAESLYQAVKDLTTNSEDARRIGLAGWRSSRERYGWESIVNDTVNLYESTQNQFASLQSQSV